MLDKHGKSVYIWYSPATDVTGKKLTEALGVTGGTKKPTQSSKKLVIGWGAKTKESVSLGKLKVLNHPDHIRINRNKLEALKLMKAAKVNVAPFVEAGDINRIGTSGCDVTLPAIARKKYHQAGKGFWECPTMLLAKEAVSEGAQYIQSLIEIENEYRLHVVGNEVIYAVRKQKRTIEEMEAAYIEQQKEHMQKVAAKRGETLDEATLDATLRAQAKRFALQGPNMIVRSNKLGWKFVRVKDPDKALCKEAVKALKAINLDFGAVDCCTDSNGKPWIIEVNTGPGLDGTPFKAWTEALANKALEIVNPKSVKQKVVDKITGKSKPVAPTLAAAGSRKDELAKKLATFQEMVAVADDTEVAAIESLAKKMFG
jgi:glutathione synthase/RimK-type ligase-like ATP-grasp enzyme